MHFHGSAYNVLFFGQKHWRFLPPRHTGLSGIPADTYFAAANRLAGSDGGTSMACMHVLKTRGGIAYILKQVSHAYEEALNRY